MAAVKGRRRVPSAALGRPHSSAEAGPGKSQWVEPACGGEGVARHGEGWAAASGGQAVEPRRSRSGAAPAGSSTEVKKGDGGCVKVPVTFFNISISQSHINNMHTFQERKPHSTFSSQLLSPYLLGGAALLGGVDQKLVEEVDGLWTRVRDDLLQWDGRVLLKGDLVVIGQINHFLPTVVHF